MKCESSLKLLNICHILTCRFKYFVGSVSLSGVPLHSTLVGVDIHRRRLFLQQLLPLHQHCGNHRHFSRLWVQLWWLQWWRCSSRDRLCCRLRNHLLKLDSSEHQYYSCTARPYLNMVSRHKDSSNLVGTYKLLVAYLEQQRCVQLEHGKLERILSLVFSSLLLYFGQLWWFVLLVFCTWFWWLIFEHRILTSSCRGQRGWWESWRSEICRF